jgi:hypothetical protein
VRVLLAAVAALCLVACGSGTVRLTSAPFAKDPLLESTGRPDVGSAPGGGELVRFIPRAAFGIGIVFRNTSHEALVVTDVSVAEPPHSQVHQIGTTLLAWKPFTCPPGAFSCPFHGFELRPFTARPHPITVDPGNELAVALGFRLGSCTAHSASRAAPSRGVIVFRAPGEKMRRQAFRLGTARLRLAPDPPACSLRG